MSEERLARGALRWHDAGRGTHALAARRRRRHHLQRSARWSRDAVLPTGVPRYGAGGARWPHLQRGPHGLPSYRLRRRHAGCW